MRLLLLVLTVLSATAHGSLAPDMPSREGIWYQADVMVNRLREERRKLRLIFQELERIQYMGQDFRDLQLYPTRVTLLGSEDDVRLDRMIEGLERNLASTRKRVLELEKPLEDAYFIAREMLQEKPNQDMIDLLLKDNVDRIGRLVMVQKELNRRWDEAFALLGEYRNRIGMRKPGGGPIEEDFFKVLMANAGRASQRFYGELNDYKDSVAARAGKAEWERMASLDLARIKVRLSSKNIEMVQEDLERLSVRFQGRISIGLVDYFLGASFMKGEKPLKAAEAYARVPAASRMHGRASLGILQAMFESRQDDSLVARFAALTGTNALDASLLPQARYLAVQSAYALGRDSLVESFVSAATAKDAYHFKSLAVYAKSLVRLKRFAEARGILVGLVSGSQIGKRLHNQAQLALSHLNFEESHFETALKGYQNLLDQPGFQAEALYGMVWANIRLGDLEAAEFILKKLITQYPDNPWAIEGFNVLVRKVMLKARNEWAFRLQVDKEQARLDELGRRAREREEENRMTREQARGVREKLAQAGKALARAKPMSPEAIARIYQQGLGLCDFVAERYRSGEFSEQAFHREREAVLAKLAESDSGGTAAGVGPSGIASNGDAADGPGSGRMAADSAGFRQRIKLKVFENRALALDIHVMHKSWLEELLKYTQLKLNEEIASLRNDSAQSARRAELSRRSRTLADDISERLAGKADDILARIGDLTEDPNSIGLMDWLLFQKGFLRYGLEEDALKKKLASFQWLEAKAGGPLPAGASEPVLDPAGFEAPWMELIARFPDSPYIPAALYYMGYSRTLRGETESGLAYFEELASRFPQALYAQQALIFIGEYHFNENRLEKAAEAYDKILDYADSKYFEQALYKLAWTRYRANAYKPAISSFTYILEEAARNSSGQAKSVLTSEALQFAALSIAESDTSGDGGLNQSKAFADKLGDSNLGAKLLHRMAVIYTQAGRMDRSKRALEALQSGYADYEKMPEALMELGRAYEKEQDYQRATEVREKIFRTYCRGGEWYGKLASPRARADADSMSQIAIEMVARHYLYEAKQAKPGTGDGARIRETNLRKAISAYDSFLEVYPESPNKAKYNYQQAEAYYSLEEYGSAAGKYMLVSRTADPKLRKAAAFNAIVAAQELLKKAEDAKK